MNDLFTSLPVTVEFHGTSLVTMWRDKKPYVAVKPISDALGLEWASQLLRIKRDTVLSKAASIMEVTYEFGVKPTTFLPLGLIPGWLFGISDRRVRPELRSRIMEYKSECYDVLARHFYGKATPKQLPQPNTVQVRAYTRRKAISPAVKRYTAILEEVLEGYAFGATYFNGELRKIGRMKNFRQAMMDVLTMAADMAHAGATQEQVSDIATYGGRHIGQAMWCTKLYKDDVDVLLFPEAEARFNHAVKALIDKGLMAPRHVY